ncbi:MAG: hypothetical protein AAFX10_16500 [Pseudomonadota bacterium]
MDRLRDYSLLELMKAASRSAAYTGPERRRQDRGIGARAPGNDNANAVCRERVRYSIATSSVGGRPAMLEPIAVGNDLRGRPVIVPYIADGGSPAGGLIAGRHAHGAAGKDHPDFSSTVILPAPVGPGSQ